MSSLNGTPSPSDMRYMTSKVGFASPDSILLSVSRLMPTMRDRRSFVRLHTARCILTASPNPDLYFSFMRTGYCDLFPKTVTIVYRFGYFYNHFG